MKYRYSILFIITVVLCGGCTNKVSNTISTEVSIESETAISTEAIISETSIVEINTEETINTEEETVVDIPEIKLPEFKSKSDTIANLWIPSCNIVANIRYGSTMRAVANRNVGEFECSDPIGEGNYSILGHSNEKVDYIFSGMEATIKDGDEIYVLKEDNLYKFRVYEKLVVNPDDVWILQSTEQPIITIMCCTNSGKQRFVVRGLLESKTVLS